MAEAVEDAFRYDRLVVCCATYDAGLFPVMEDFIHHLKAKAYQKRTVGFVENGTWACGRKADARGIRGYEGDQTPGSDRYHPIGIECRF